MATAHLLDAGCGLEAIASRVPVHELRTIATMLERRVNTPPTSSLGRLFDAVAAIAGVRDRVTYEGQAALQLEWLATDVPVAGEYPFEIPAGDGFASRPPGARDDGVAASPLIIDTRPLIRAVVEDGARGVGSRTIARRFHSTIVALIRAVCRELRIATGLNTVVLSGGVFMNALLTAEATARLTQDGFRPYRHRLVPPNDAGLSLGQLAMAAACEEGRLSNPSMCSFDFEGP
jgi:hydrogenase maturation protein HypF